MAIFTQHPVFEAPANENAGIWRYLTFSKFISLINSHALYFTVANRFEDKWEGTLPVQRKENMDERIVSFYEQSRSMNAINCWHMRESETATMWKSYTHSNEGIAVKSTYKRLSSCFLDREAAITYQCPVFIGKVKYIDYTSETFDSSNGYVPLLHKRNFFADESEVRAVIGGGHLSNFFVQGLP